MSTNEQWSLAKNLLEQCREGILSTHSLDVSGYPFGSLTPYALDANHCPVILISSLAQHTKNIIQNAKVCLTVTESAEASNKQALGRVSYMADAAIVLDEPETFDSYFARFPESKGYFGTHDFAFYRLNPVRLRFIGGFGKIFWIEKEALK